MGPGTGLDSEARRLSCWRALSTDPQHSRRTAWWLRVYLRAELPGHRDPRVRRAVRNPRGSNGYGRVFSDGSVFKGAAATTHDLMAGLDTAIRHNRVDRYDATRRDRRQLWRVHDELGHYADHSFQGSGRGREPERHGEFLRDLALHHLVEAEFNGMPWDNWPLLWQWSLLAHVASVGPDPVRPRRERSRRADHTGRRDVRGAEETRYSGAIARYPGEERIPATGPSNSTACCERKPGSRVSGGWIHGECGRSIAIRCHQRTVRPSARRGRT